MKTKSNPKPKLPVLSRLTQKTFIIVSALVFLSSAAMVGKFYFDTLRAGDAFNFGASTVYVITTVVAPLLTFVIVYLLSTEKVTQLWRMSKALIVTLMATIFATFASIVNSFMFSEYLGYGGMPAISYGSFIELAPVVLAIALAIATSLILSKSKDSTKSDASTLLQKLFLISVLVFGLGQPLLSFLGQPGGSISQPQMDAGTIMGIAASLAIPTIMLGVIYLLTSRQRTVLQRSFITLFYVTMGVLLSIAIGPIPYLFTDPYSVGDQSGFLVYAPMILTFIAFVGVVAWHKMKKVL
jgi:hypothetical protein